MIRQTVTESAPCPLDGADMMWWPEGSSGMKSNARDVRHIKAIVKLMKDAGQGTDVCIQAGGANGLWPIALSEHFRHVTTIEPHPGSFAAMVKNLQDFEIENVIGIYAGLADRPGRCHVESRTGDAATCYTMPGGETPVIPIDKIPVDGCVDLIYLDIEGREYEALRGAAKTIERDRPWICIEQKWLRSIQGEGKPIPYNSLIAGEMVEHELKYEKVQAFHLDRLFRPGKEIT